MTIKPVTQYITSIAFQSEVIQLSIGLALDKKKFFSIPASASSPLKNV